MEGNVLHEQKAQSFIEHCIDKFKWRDLSNAVIMDAGCGVAGYCGKAILEKFPVVRRIVFIDNNQKELSNFQLERGDNMECEFADIEKRETLQKYEGKMDKVISTYVFHQLKEKEEAFRNVYHLLKPAGEAAVVFIKNTLLYEWLQVLLQKPKWKRAYTDVDIENAVESEFGADYYREMVERIGFEVVDCKEVETVIPYPSDQDCKDSLYHISRKYFNIQSLAFEEFEEDCFQALLILSPRDDEGKPCQRATEVLVLLTKPAETSKIQSNVLHEQMAKTFVEHCKVEFKWRDLSNDVIMDVGCGEAGYCGKAILEIFEVVGAFIFVDKNPEEILNFQLERGDNMECVVANIENWETLRSYAGNMDKVISTYVFQEVVEKEEAFRSVYYLLKPGGEAAVVFIKKSLLYEWLGELLKKPKWNESYKDLGTENEVETEFGADYYREMVEKIGFQVVECKEEATVIPYPSDQDCKESLYQMSRNKFYLPSEAIEEFKEDSFQALLKVSPRDGEGKPCHRSTVVTVLLTKPTEGCASKAK